MNRIRRQNGLTLIECMITILILMIVFGGVTGFRYHSVLNAQRAEDQLLAARAAVAISEAWRGQRGATDFDPMQQGYASDFQIQQIETPLKAIDESGKIILGRYQVEIEGRQYQARLTYTNDAGVPNARMLDVVLTWQDKGKLRQQFQLSTLTRTNS